MRWGDVVVQYVLEYLSKCKSTICKSNWLLKITCTILPDDYVMVIHSLKKYVHSGIQAVFLQS